MFYTAQQTSVYSVYFVVKNDSVADLRKIVMAMPKIFLGHYTDMRYAVWYNIRC